MAFLRGVMGLLHAASVATATSTTASESADAEAPAGERDSSLSTVIEHVEGTLDGRPVYLAPAADMTVAGLAASCRENRNDRWLFLYTASLLVEVSPEAHIAIRSTADGTSIYAVQGRC